jgi:hypothetical protein
MDSESPVTIFTKLAILHYPEPDESYSNRQALICLRYILV